LKWKKENFVQMSAAGYRGWRFAILPRTETRPLSFLALSIQKRLCTGVGRGLPGLALREPGPISIKVTTLSLTGETPNGFAISLRMELKHGRSIRLTLKWEYFLLYRCRHSNRGWRSEDRDPRGSAKRALLEGSGFQNPSKSGHINISPSNSKNGNFSNAQVAAAGYHGWCFENQDPIQSGQ
jgi:hypothetical protein